MPNSAFPQFDAGQLVQQATQMLEGAVKQPWLEAQSMQPLVQAFASTAQALAADPHTQAQRAFQLHQSHLALAANYLESLLGGTPEPVATPPKGDTRFAHESWNTAYFNLLKQSYLLTSQWLQGSVDEARGLSPEDRAQASFYTRQFIEALSPSNFLPTNPEALTTAVETNGQSLLQGFKNLVEDLRSGRISMTDYQHFKVGQNLATTPGQVVFRNRLIELIQYTPAGKQVYEKPLLICPPWINRFYILDLQQHNSLVNYLVGQGFQVFMVSWKNPTPAYRNVGFEDYISEGLLAALEATLAISGQKSVNAVGYCIGGTMLATALAVMEAKNDKRINTATFLTTLMDFSQAGELSLFTNAAQLAALEAKMQRDGILSGRDMAKTFSMLRASDLIWNFVTNNYLLGKQPMPFDILYWNDDSTCMPAAMHSWYLRKLYLENKLVQPGALTVLNTPVNLSAISLPMYMVTGINDHITPWESCYKPYAAMASKNKRFVLGKAGHVAGVVSPPTPAGKPVKRHFWVGNATEALGKNWLPSAEQKPDTWWPDYAAWLAPHSGAKVAAPAKPGNAGYQPLCPAPGTYVLER